MISKVYSNAFQLKNSTPEQTFDPKSFYTPKQTKARTKVSKQEISPLTLNGNIFWMKSEMMKSTQIVRIQRIFWVPECIILSKKVN